MPFDPGKFIKKLKFNLESDHAKRLVYQLIKKHKVRGHVQDDIIIFPIDVLFVLYDVEYPKAGSEKFIYGLELMVKDKKASYASVEDDGEMKITHVGFHPEAFLEDEG